MQQDIMVTKNQPLDLEMVELIAGKHGFDVQVATSPEDLLEEYVEDAPETLKPRAPVVTVMGHVDHGKTALLDAIRRTNVMAGEAGGITQHIGAYTVELESGRVVFLDTPGHEAFTAMRAHGAQVTDVVVLVVAADDGIMPQTLEAVNHARAAEVPIVVAINKIDKPTANVDRVKKQLADIDLLPEDWGGKTITVSVSAKTKDGIAALLEMLLLEADLLELKANPDRSAQGVVLEAKLDRGRGPVATVLVQSGTLHVGDAFIVGSQYGRVRALLSDKGDPLAEAGPATPVEVLGFTGVPEASNVFVAVDDEKKARQIADSRALKVRQKEMMRHKRITLEDLYEQIQAGEVKELNLIIKGDVQGSVVALQDALLKLPTENVKLNVIHAGVGGIKESDVILASASNALLIGFNVRPDANARELAAKEGIDYRLYRVIYDLIDDVRAAMEGLLEPEKKEIFLGRAEVLQMFKVSEVGTVAGSRVLEGEITVEGRVRVVRDGVIVLHDGKISSLKRYKDFARSAPAGTECGIGIENFNDIKVGDVIECYRIEEIARTL
jgi:translation initiation factor IF-2